MYEFILRAGYCASSLLTNCAEEPARVEVTWLDWEGRVVKVEEITPSAKIMVSGEGYYELKVWKKSAGVASL